MRKITLFLFALLMMVGNAVAQVSYPVGTGVVDAKCNPNSTKRYYGGVTLRNNYSGDLQVVSFNEGITEATRNNYNIYNNCADSEQYFTIKAGATINARYIAGWDGAWMHSYIFLDKDNDRNFTIQSPNDLVASTSGTSFLEHTPTFTAPTTPGTYYMRYKVDWDNNSPTELGSMIVNGGMMTDVKLVVEALNVSTEFDPELGNVAITNTPTACGQELSFNVTPKEGYVIKSIKVRCGDGLDGEQTKTVSSTPAGLQYVPSLTEVTMWKETSLDINGTTYTLPGANVQGDLMIIVEFESLELTSAKYYRLKNVAYNTYLFSAIADKTGTGGTVYAVKGNKTLFNGALNNSDASYVWKIEEYSNGVKYVSNQGLYLAPLNTTEGAVALLQEEPTNMQVTLKDGYYVIGTPGVSTSATNHQPFLHALNVYSNDKYPETTIGNYVTHWEAGANASKWVFEEATTIDITIGAGGYSTIKFPFPVQLPQGLTGYVGAEDNGAELTLEPVVNGGGSDGSDKVPSNTPLILQGTQGETYTLMILGEEVTATSYQDYLDANKLSGTLMAESFEDGHGRNIYGIATVNDETKFYKMTNGATTIGKNKAYYERTSGAEAPAKLNIIFGKGTATGIGTIIEKSELGKVYYDLNGRRVFYPTRGIYVTGSGKKVFVK